MTRERDFDVTLSDDTAVKVRLALGDGEYEIVTFSTPDGAPIDLDEEQDAEAVELASKAAGKAGWEPEDEEDYGEDDGDGEDVNDAETE